MGPAFQSLIQVILLGLMHLSQQHSSEVNSTWESTAPWYLSTQKMDGAPSRDFEGSMHHISSRSNWFFNGVPTSSSMSYLSLPLPEFLQHSFAGVAVAQLQGLFSIIILTFAFFFVLILFLVLNIKCKEVPSLQLFYPSCRSSVAEIIGTSRMLWNGFLKLLSKIG